MEAALLPRRFQRPLSRLVREARAGWANSGTVPLARQLAMWRHGFYGQNASLYDVDRYGFGAFVSDLQRATRLSAVNDPKDRAILNDKLLTYYSLRSIGAPTPELHGFANGERPVYFDPAVRGVEDLLRARGTLVVKPRDGSGGNGFQLLQLGGEGVTVNGELRTDADRVVRGSVVVSDFLRQHEYARALHPGTTNTLRVLVLRDARTGEPFVAKAVQRVGADGSGPVDNVARGGLSANLDVQTGTIGPLAALPGVHFPVPGPVRWLDRHPDTGAQIQGVVVPGWEEIKAGLCRVTATFEGLRCVGWDVGVTDDGYTIIEGNNRPDVTMQVHRPFLDDERSREAFAAVGITGAG